MKFEELDEETRKWMLIEFKDEESGKNPYRSPRLNSTDQKEFGKIMKENDPSNKISDEAILERSFSFCNEAMHTISLQVRRLQTSEPEDSRFLHRQWADLRFLILSLDRLDKAVGIAKNVKRISSEVKKAQDKFQKSIPFLRDLRNVGEHFDSYSMDNGYLDSVSKKDLQVGTWNEDGTCFTWLGEELDVIESEKAAIELFKTIRNIKNSFFKKRPT